MMSRKEASTLKAQVEEVILHDEVMLEYHLCPPALGLGKADTSLSRPTHDG